MKEALDRPAFAHINEPLLKGLGALPLDHSLKDARLILDVHGGDGWVYGYRVTSTDPSGKHVDSYFKEKHLLSISRPLAEQAQNHISKIRGLQNLGIPTPVTYGAVGGTLYQEFVPNEQLDESIQEIEKAKNPLDVQQNLDQLIGIAALLDGSQFDGRQFVRDLLFDADRGIYLFNDVGSDLGMFDSPQPDYRGAHTHLLTRFPSHREYIVHRYQDAQAIKERTVVAA